MKVAQLPNGFYKGTRNSTFLQNTTVFDAPFHVIFCMLADDESLKKETFNSIVNGNLKIFMESYFKKGALQQTLLRRTQVLELLFQTQVVDGMRTIDCSSKDVKNVFEYYLPMMFNSIKMISVCKCAKVNKFASYIELNRNRWNSMQRFQNIDFSESNICSKCERIETTFDLGNFLFLSVDQNVSWQNIPKVALLQGNHYKLTAFIEKNHNYYIAHVRRPNQKWYTFDHTNKDVKQTYFYKEMNIRMLCFCVESVYDEYMYQHILANAHTLYHNEKEIQIVNSCAVNSVLHLLSCLYIDSPQLFDQNSGGGDMMEFLEEFARNRSQMGTSSTDPRYELRYKILAPHFEERKSGNFFGVDCWTNVHGILDLMIMNDFPSLKTWCNCSPTIQNKFSVFDVNLQKLEQFGLNDLENCLDFPRRKCNLCQMEIENHSVGNILFLDVQPITVPGEGIDIPPVEVSVNQISQMIHLNGNQYILKGIIEYVGGNHYVANCLRGNNRWYNIDDIRQTIIHTSKLIPHILLYVKNI